ncbi:MAG: PAS domain S-box protein [Chitinophagaceae bacterium]|nr:MAG: PAS domain S-box protein [Chitinophagaceae bacterium]
MKTESILLSDEQSIFKALLDAAPDATVILDGNGLVQIINKQTEKLFGYKKWIINPVTVNKIVKQ